MVYVNCHCCCRSAKNYSNCHWLYPVGSSVRDLNVKIHYVFARYRLHTITHSLFVRISVLLLSFCELCNKLCLCVCTLCALCMLVCIVLCAKTNCGMLKKDFMSHLKYADNFPFISLNVSYNLRICIN